MRKTYNRFMRWFTKEQLSYFDLCLIFIGISIGKWVLSHLVWR